MFIIPSGHYEYLAMHFGLRNAPVVFQHFINETLQETLNPYTFVYLNDILIFRNSLKERVSRPPGPSAPSTEPPVRKAREVTVLSHNYLLLGPKTKAASAHVGPAGPMVLGLHKLFFCEEFQYPEKRAVLSTGFPSCTEPITVTINVNNTYYLVHIPGLQ